MGGKFGKDVLLVCTRTFQLTIALYVKCILFTAYITLAGYSPWDCKQSDTSEARHMHLGSPDPLHSKIIGKSKSETHLEIT